MRLLEVTIAVDDVAACRRFYSVDLGLAVVDESVDGFSVRVGRSILRLVSGSPAGPHHLAFEVPANRVAEAAGYLAPLAEVIRVDGREVVHIDPWNADAVYFRDPAGTILELIGHHGVSPESALAFGPGSILGIAEIGLPVPEVSAAIAALGPLGSLWPDHEAPFAPVGDRHGSFIVVPGGRAWFPTAEPAVSVPLEVVVAGAHVGVIAVPGIDTRLRFELDRRWPPGLASTVVRVARPTDRLDEIVWFYRDVIGLAEVGSFAGHEGYRGAILGLPDATLQVEFTQHDEGSPCPAPTLDNLLVLALADESAHGRLASRLELAGVAPVVSENPYWDRVGLTVEDPDGWRVVLVRPGWS